MLHFHLAGLPRAGWAAMILSLAALVAFVLEEAWRYVVRARRLTRRLAEFRMEEGPGPHPSEATSSARGSDVPGTAGVPPFRRFHAAFVRRHAAPPRGSAMDGQK
jgi:hypothetical protein